MTRKEIAEMIETIGVKYAYYQFPEGTNVAPPFICFYYTGSNDVLADNTNYQRIDTLIIELYTDTKDFTLESSVEAVLNLNGLVFNKAEQYIDTEQLFEQIYTADVIITEDN